MEVEVEIWWIWVKPQLKLKKTLSSVDTSVSTIPIRILIHHRIIDVMF
jgi:hypothetical protein